jgi:hypothetical protein
MVKIYLFYFAILNGILRFQKYIILLNYFFFHYLKYIGSKSLNIQESGIFSALSRQR